MWIAHKRQTIPVYIGTPKAASVTKSLLYLWNKAHSVIHTQPTLFFFLSKRLSRTATIKTSVQNRNYQLSHLMTKPTKRHVHPAKTQISLGIRPVWSESWLSAWKTLGPQLPIERSVKTLIRLGGCPGWSGSSLGAHAISLVLSWGHSVQE